MVGSVVASDGAGGAVGPGLFVAGASLAGASGVDGCCADAGGDDCAQALTLSDERKTDIDANRRGRNNTVSPILQGRT